MNLAVVGLDRAAVQHYSAHHSRTAQREPSHRRHRGQQHPPARPTRSTRHLRNAHHHQLREPRLLPSAAGAAFTAERRRDLGLRERDGEPSPGPRHGYPLA